MRYTFTLLAVLCFLISYAQPRPHNNECRTALPDKVFNQKFKSVQMMHSDNQKLEAAKSIALENCLNAGQVKALTELIVDEHRKLEFAEIAWERTVDKDNYYYVYDAFANLSTVFMLHDYIGGAAHSQYPYDPMPPFDPGHHGNFEPLPCRIGQEQYHDMLESIRKEPFNSTKSTIAKNIIQSNPCFYSRQIKEVLELFSFDDSKLEIAKFAYDYTIDKENYYKVADSFSFSSSKEDLIEFIRKHQP